MSKWEFESFVLDFINDGAYRYSRRYYNGAVTVYVTVETFFDGVPEKTVTAAAFNDDDQLIAMNAWEVGNLSGFMVEPGCAEVMLVAQAMHWITMKVDDRWWRDNG